MAGFQLRTYYFKYLLFFSSVIVLCFLINCSSEDPAIPDDTDEPMDSTANGNRYSLYDKIDLTNLPIDPPQDPELPSTTRQVSVTTLEQLENEFAQGSVEITLGVTLEGQGTAILIGEDVDLIIPEDIRVDHIMLSNFSTEEGSRRIRIRGPGEVGAIQNVFDAKNVSDIILEGLVLNNTFVPLDRRPSPNVHFVGSSRIAVISCVIYNHGLINSNSGEMVGPNFLMSSVSDVVLANNNMGASQSTEGDNWCFRASNSERLILIDNFFYGGPWRSTIREGGETNNMIVMSSEEAIGTDRETVIINLGLPFIHMEQFNPNTDQIYHQDTRIWFDNVNNTNLNIVGLNGHPGSAAFWNVASCEFHARNSTMVSDEVLTNIEGFAQGGEDWNYNIGTHSYNYYDDRASLIQSIPEPPIIFSELLQRNLPQNNPFDLD